MLRRPSWNEYCKQLFAVAIESRVQWVACTFALMGTLTACSQASVSTDAYDHSATSFAQQESLRPQGWSCPSIEKVQSILAQRPPRTTLELLQAISTETGPIGSAVKIVQSFSPQASFTTPLAPRLLFYTRNPADGFNLGAAYAVAWPNSARSVDSGNCTRQAEGLIEMIALCRATGADQFTNDMPSRPDGPEREQQTRVLEDLSKMRQRLVFAEIIPSGDSFKIQAATKCASCHQGMPIWEPYPFWGNAIGSVFDNEYDRMHGFEPYVKNEIDAMQHLKTHTPPSWEGLVGWPSRTTAVEDLYVQSIRNQKMGDVMRGLAQQRAMRMFYEVEKALARHGVEFAPYLQLISAGDTVANFTNDDENTLSSLALLLSKLPNGAELGEPTTLKSEFTEFKTWWHRVVQECQRARARVFNEAHEKTWAALVRANLDVETPRPIDVSTSADPLFRFAFFDNETHAEDYRLYPFLFAMKKLHEAFGDMAIDLSPLRFLQAMSFARVPTKFVHDADVLTVLKDNPSSAFVTLPLFGVPGESPLEYALAFFVPLYDLW